MSKTILITGSAGQLGNELRELTKNEEFKNFNFIFSDIVSTDTSVNTILDITNPDALNSFFKNQHVDYIINSAAYTAVDKSETDFQNAHKLNAVAPGYLAEIAGKINAKFIHISTDYVFSGNTFIPYNENSEADPQSAYGKTKLEGEKNVIKKNPLSIIVRTSWLYSFYGNNFVKTILKYARERGKLNVVYDQIGSPTYAKDLAHSLLMIISDIENNKASFIPGVYHYSNEGVCSWYDFAKAIVNYAQINCVISPIESKDYPLPAKRPFYSVLNKSKIKTSYNTDIPYWMDSLEECIKRILKG